MKTKMIKKASILWLIAIALFTGGFAQAQPSGGQQGPPPVPNAKQIQKTVAKVSKKLSLNEEQEKQVSKLYVAHFDEVKKATSSGRPERSTMEALDAKFEKEVNKVLTPDQQKLFAAYQKKNKPQQMGGQRPNS
jgi:Spy/CpxP family protein refolding chaperone